MSMFAFGIICGIGGTIATFIFLDWRDSIRFQREMEKTLDRLEQQDDVRLSDAVRVTKINSQYVRTYRHD